MKVGLIGNRQTGTLLTKDQVNANVLQMLLVRNLTVRVVKDSTISRSARVPAGARGVQVKMNIALP